MTIRQAEDFRLSDATLARAAPEVTLPGYVRPATRIGVMHFGPGAFFRGHQAFYFDRLLVSDPAWAISAVSLKSPGVRDALAPQDGLYTLLELDAEVRARVIGSVRELLVAPETPDRVLARLAHPGTRLVTLTVTEKGYTLDGEGRLDLTHPDVRHDLERPDDAPKSAVGWLTAGLRARRQAGLAPFTTLSCDNLSDNGRKLGGAVAALAEASGDAALARWIAAEARFPRTMVDSITPATDDALRERAKAMTGLEDAWPIQREAYVQWVIEDAFAPADRDLADGFARAGATLAAEIAPYERAKLRLLNGAHSTLAYVGLLAGLETVSDAMAEPRLAQFVRTLMTHDVAPTLAARPGLDLDAYTETVLARFRNPAIRHALAQIAWDGSQKLPVRLLSTVRERLAAGARLERLAIPLAAWMRFVVMRVQAGGGIVDPLADDLLAIGRAALGDAAADVDRFLSLHGVWGDLADDATFRAALRRAYTALGARDPLAALQQRP